MFISFSRLLEAKQASILKIVVLIVGCVLATSGIQMLHADPLPGGNAMALQTEKADADNVAPIRARILRDGRELDQKTLTVLPGQRINLTLDINLTPTELATTKFLWTLPGTTFANYTSSNATDAESQTYKTPVFPESLRKQSISFYWSDTGDKVIKCRYNTGTVKGNSPEVTFHVLPFQYTFENEEFFNSQIVGPTGLDTSTYLTLIGPKLNGKNQSGIYNKFSVQIPNSYKNVIKDPNPANMEGSYYVTQTQVRTINQVVNDGTANYTFYLLEDKHFGLDNQVRYPLNYSKNPTLPESDTALQPTGTAARWQVDTPSMALPVDPVTGGDYVSAYIKDDFKTYLMAIPPGTDSCAVPVASLTWGWSCSAIYNTNKWWPNAAVPTPLSQYKGTVQPETAHPEWAQVLGHFVAGELPFSVIGSIKLGLPPSSTVTEGQAANTTTLTMSRALGVVPVYTASVTNLGGNIAIPRIVVTAPGTPTGQVVSDIGLTYQENTSNSDSTVLKLAVQSDRHKRTDSAIIVWVNNDVEDVEE